MTFYPEPAERERDDPLATHNFPESGQSQAPRLRTWRQLIPTCIQRLGLAEWPKWQQSSWPWRRRSVEWFSLCPCGHRGLVEMGCFLRGHLAACVLIQATKELAFPLGLKEGPLWSQENLYTRWWHHLHACMSPALKSSNAYQPVILQALTCQLGGMGGYWILTIITNFTDSGWVCVDDQSRAAEPSNPYKKNEA